MKLKPQVKVAAKLGDIDRRAFESVAQATTNPFVSYDFLLALEASGCVSPQTGWTPRHLTVEDERGDLAGFMPLYLKTHSQGEYVFDHSWAEAYQRAGGRYYPKLQCASPFSPVTGPRFLVRPDIEAGAGVGALLGGAATLTDRLGASSLHITFLTEAEWRLCGDAGLLLRQDQQFHWNNRGYADFDAFLGDLSSNRRKNIRRERRDASKGLTIERLSGSDLQERHWDAFYEFYTDTGRRKWGRPYLNRRFFSLIGQSMADQIVLVMAKRGESYIAGALNFIGDDCLFGRNWGALEQVPFLHFELCYYQAIEEAIKRGLARVEAGAQGEHKLARGYLPSLVYSAHFIADPALRQPVERYLEQERRAVRQEMEYLEDAYSPFRQSGEAGAQKG